MKITDEAVKAALEAFWDNEDEPIMTGMKRALEAAAPHIEGAALRAVADKFQARLPDGTGNGRAYNSYQVAGILRSCADDIEPTHMTATRPGIGG